MEIEDLPIIREQDITDQSTIVDRAEICYSLWHGPNAHALCTELYLVLGRREDGSIFVTDHVWTDENIHGWKCIAARDPDRPYRIIREIKNYTSLAPTTGKTE